MMSYDSWKLASPDDNHYDPMLDCDDCWQCGGEGGWNSCIEDCCSAEGGEEGCDDPGCWRWCDVCKGEGVL
jgi:hypothetical protein